MTVAAMGAVLRGLKVKQSFRLWFHPEGTYQNDGNSWLLDDFCLMDDEVNAMLDGKSIDRVVRRVDNQGVYVENYAAATHYEHAKLFSAIEAL